MCGCGMSFSSNYNMVDRGLHYFAFCSPFVQKTLSDLENDLFKNELKAIDSRNEVFVTGLPRAGTTLMLELLNATGEFQTFRYSDMPFILSPLLWNTLSRSFRKVGKMQERAHGDGMEISVESPEAFDEVVWLTYMAKQIINDDRLEPVTAKEVDEEFSDAIRNSVRKVLALSRREGSDAELPRYLSKNNANISRIDALLELFPTSKILVLFRNPLAHTSSLATQHKRFLAEHASDAFSRKYMRWIGHYEFGENFKPIDFGGWLDGVDLPPQADETFWLNYWNAAYAYAMVQKTNRVHFVDFDRLLEEGAVSLQRLGGLLALKNQSELPSAGKRLRSPTTKPMELGQCPPDVWNRAKDIHAQLKSLAV